MRGAHGYTESMFTMSKLDDFVPANHPLRPIRLWLNEALARMDTVFSRTYQLRKLASRFGHAHNRSGLRLFTSDDRATPNIANSLH